MLFKRKLYDKLLNWKQNAQGKKALLIEGARRIGKSTLAETFAKNEYRSYLLIDFNDVSPLVIDCFEHHLTDLDTFFMLLSTEYKKTLFPRESLIIFDEIQKYPKARQSIKLLVKDGRFDYLETGSLISLRENVKDITLPSEERSVKMYPMDFEEFCWAFHEEPLLTYIRACFEQKTPLERTLHDKAMILFKQFMLVGGMPQSLSAYLENDRNFQKADIEKRDILTLYRNDIMKIEQTYRAKVLSIFDQIPAFLSQHEKRVVFNKIEQGSYFSQYSETFFWLSDSMIVNDCFNATDPNVGLAKNESRAYLKCYMGDTGLLVSHAFKENEIMEQELYRQILRGKLSINEGMLYENAIAQILVGNGHKLFFYIRYDETKHRNDIEVDFVLSNQATTHFKIIPIEVKSSPKYSTASFEKFMQKFSERMDQAYIIHPKNLSQKGNILMIPPYMALCL